jgi:hypothetical protein
MDGERGAGLALCVLASRDDQAVELSSAVQEEVWGARPGLV